MFIEFHLPTRGKPPWQFSVIQSLKFAKGNKRITQKWRQLWQVVVCRCSVPSVISSDRTAAFLKCWVQYKWHAYGSNLHAFFFSPPIIGHFNSCTVHLVWREGRWANFWCSTMQVRFLRSCKMYPLYRNLQHVVYQDWMGGTQWHSTDI